MFQNKTFPHLLCELRLEEVDVLGEVEGVLARLADHVGVQHVVGLLEDADHVRLLVALSQRTLQQLHQQIDHLSIGKQISWRQRCTKPKSAITSGLVLPRVVFFLVDETDLARAVLLVSAVRDLSV